MGALIPIALSLAPEIGRWLFGAGAEHTTAAVVNAVQAVTGTADEAAATVALARDPQPATQLRVQLAQIAATAEADARKGEMDRLSAQIADTTNARAQTVALAQAHSPIAWGAAVISGVVLVTFAIVLWITLDNGVPQGAETIVNMMLGTLAAMATSVVSYWVGSSAGADRKDAALAGRK